MRAPAILLTISAAVAMHAHNAAAQPTRVTECRTITEPGSYVLARNLSARGNCLVIEAEFVTIDLAGFAITGNGTGTGIRAIPVLREAVALGIAVRNGTIFNFELGIVVVGAAIIEGIRAIGNDGSGIVVSPNTGSIVSGNIAQRNNGNGIVAGGVVSGNTSLENSSDGISAGQGSIVSGNTARDNNRGIFSDRGSTITDNTVSDNGVGILAFEGGSTVSGNTARDNDIGIEASEGSTVSGNTARDNDIGIQVECPSNLIGNTATGNSRNLFRGADCNEIDNLPR